MKGEWFTPPLSWHDTNLRWFLQFNKVLLFTLILTIVQSRRSQSLGRLKHKASWCAKDRKEKNNLHAGGDVWAECRKKKGWNLRSHRHCDVNGNPPLLSKKNEIVLWEAAVLTDCISPSVSRSSFCRRSRVEINQVIVNLKKKIQPSWNLQIWNLEIPIRNLSSHHLTHKTRTCCWDHDTGHPILRSRIHKATGLPFYDN